MLTNRLKKAIKDYPDFPKKGIIFKDLNPIFSDPDLFQDLIEKMSLDSYLKKADAIVAIDARGFIYGAAIANNINKPFILARKENKLPGELIKKNYGLEYGEDTLSLQKSALSKFKNFVIVDDLLATGGTAECIINLLLSENKNVLSLNVVVELNFLQGRNKINCPVNSIINY